MACTSETSLRLRDDIRSDPGLLKYCPHAELTLDNRGSPTLRLSEACLPPCQLNGVVRIDIFQAKVLAFGDAERLGDFSCCFDDLFCFQNLGFCAVLGDSEVNKAAPPAQVLRIRFKNSFNFSNCVWIILGAVI